jgi:hypothetical protein
VSASAILRETLRRARLRRVVDAMLLGLPALAIAVALAWRLGGAVIAVATFAMAGVAIAAFAWHRARRLDTRWLVRELDAHRTDLEDSADLLFAPTASMTALERLQLARLQARIEAAGMPDLRPRWSMPWIAAGGGAVVLVVTALLWWPARQPVKMENVLTRIGASPTKPTQTRVLQQQLRVVPPAYTRVAAYESAALDAKAPQGTRLHWTLRFAPQPGAAELVFHDGRRVALARDGDDWRASDVLSRSALYRIVLHDAPPLQSNALHRLDAIADRPPQLRVLEPDRSLSLMTLGQRSWTLAFEASDDYGVAPAARLRITLAQGSGENITVREQDMTLRGSGPTTRKRYAQRLDLAALGFAAGDDLIVQLSVDDNRTPGPQTARSASVILRWPSDLGTETTGLEGMVKKVLPAYFRSQRQIIIDAESLLKQRRSLAADQYLQRSDAIGVDQRILRLRYGQFLGEESEGAPKPPPLPTNDAPDDPHGDGHREGADHTEAGAHADTPFDDGHDHASTAASGAAPAFGQESAVLEEYGHTHDHAEAATLLDPETRATLKSALDQMWQSELHLRQGQPERALPYANRALAFIKQVQQASRIYLARVGPELPPIDENRRLSGDRTGLSRRDDALVAATAPDPTLAGLWRALDEAPPSSRDKPQAVDFAALERWLRENQARLADPLAFVAAIEALRADPECARCRGELRELLWPLLPRPAATVPRRDGGDAVRHRYLDALEREDVQ